MKKIQTEVKSQGKAVGTVEVIQYDSLAEAVKASSEADVLKAYNKVISDKVTNTFRSEQTRTSSPMAQLTRLAKSDPKIKAEIDALIAKATQG